MKSFFLKITTLFILGVLCVFCLLVNKKAVTYRHIFFELKEKAKERDKVFDPATIISDFEPGILPIIKSKVSHRFNRQG